MSQRVRIYSTQWITQRTLCANICAWNAEAPWKLFAIISMTFTVMFNGMSMELIHRPYTHGTTWFWLRGASALKPARHGKLSRAPLVF
jgi:hypothetical protein